MHIVSGDAAAKRITHSCDASLHHFYELVLLCFILYLQHVERLKQAQRALAESMKQALIIYERHT
jgi:hypothetical protein